MLAMVVVLFVCVCVCVGGWGCWVLSLFRFLVAWLFGCVVVWLLDCWVVRILCWSWWFSCLGGVIVCFCGCSGCFVALAGFADLVLVRFVCVLGCWVWPVLPSHRRKVHVARPRAACLLAQGEQLPASKAAFHEICWCECKTAIG